MSKLTGGNAYLCKARGQLCASASIPRGPRSGSNSAGSGSTRGKQIGLPFGSRGGDGGRAMTCGVIVDLPDG